VADETEQAVGLSGEMAPEIEALGAADRKIDVLRLELSGRSQRGEDGGELGRRLRLAVGAYVGTESAPGKVAERRIRPGQAPVGVGDIGRSELVEQQGMNGHGRRDSRCDLGAGFRRTVSVGPVLRHGAPGIQPRLFAGRLMAYDPRHLDISPPDRRANRSVAFQRAARQTIAPTRCTLQSGNLL
jgi:hypothetical protein